MKKREADKLLAEQFKQLNRKADIAAEADDNEEYMQLVDSMLKVYTILSSSEDGFESDFGTTPTTIGS